VRLKGMSEVIDDRVDKFHEALMKRYSKKTLVAITIGIVLFASLYVRATYKEYDEWLPEGSWMIVRRVIIVDGQLKELNISFGQIGFTREGPNDNVTTMIIRMSYTRNGHYIYWELAGLAEAQLQALYHVKEFLGHIESRRSGDYKISIYYY
jgi:hypothetical protein